jgi:hypothetical protein
MITELKVTLSQRAYTLRLRGFDPKDSTWHDALWATHEGVNRGAKAFGDWLLTLRGGLDHNLAASKITAKGNKPARHPNLGEIKNRRIALALSWLSVESKEGAPADCLVPHDYGIVAQRRSNWKSLDTLRDILAKRGASNGEIDAWVSDCTECLVARIRDDAVWVNRSKMFDG